MERCLACEAESVGTRGAFASIARPTGRSRGVLLPAGNTTGISSGAANLLHSSALTGGREPVTVRRIAVCHFRLEPYPFDVLRLTFEVQARFVQPLTLSSKDELRQSFTAAKPKILSVTVESLQTLR